MDESPPDNTDEQRAEAGDSVELKCPECDAPWGEESPPCWLCGYAAEGLPVETPEQPAAAAAISTASFSLSSLLLVVTLVAVCCGTFSVAPGLGIGVAIIATPALLRTIGVIQLRKRKGHRSTPGEKAIAFLTSAGIVVLTLVAAGIAFYATCWVGFMGGMGAGQFWEKGPYAGIGTGLITGIVVGGIVGLFVIYKMIRWIWIPKR